MQEFDLINAPLEGTNLIEASAGTGKTYTISGLFLRLILEQKLSVSEILVVTFTKAATQELRDRIRRILKQALDVIAKSQGNDPTLKAIVDKCPDRRDAANRLASALRNFDEAAIFTIHSFCQRVLSENAFESGALFDTELVGDLSDLKQEIVDDFWRKHFYDASPLFINFIRGEKYDPDMLAKNVGKLLNKLELKIIPQISLPDVEQLESQFNETFENVKQEWKEVNDKVINIFRTFDKLNRTKYKTDKVDDWLDQLDDYLNSDGTGLLFNDFFKFTNSEINASLKKNSDPLELPFFKHCEQLKKIYDKLTSERLLALEVELYDYLKKELERRKQKQNIQYYDDFLTRLFQALNKTGGDDLIGAVRKKFKAALIDEFQDTDPIQYSIFKIIFGNKNSRLFLIGDPRQAIYSFRGADIFAYMKASKESDSKHTLKNNWRSEPELIEATNAIFFDVEHPFVFEEIPFIRAKAALTDKKDILKINGKSDEPFRLWFIDADKFGNGKIKLITKTAANEMISRAVAAEISKLLDLAKNSKATIGDDILRAGDIAILVRQNKEARPISEALSALDIPSVLYSDENVFDSHEALELERVLTGIAMPHNEKLLKAALATDMLGLSGGQIYDLSENESVWESWLIKFRTYNDLWHKRGFFGMLRDFIANEGVRNRLLSFPDGERRLTNLLHLAELLHQQSIANNLEINRLVKWLSEHRDQNNHGIEEHQLRLESDENAVKIVTIHKSKGLEYPVVFCPFTWSGSTIDKDIKNIFHDVDNDYKLTLDLSPVKQSKYKSITEKELLAENLRLLYVALTRARNRCYLVWGKFKKAGTSAMTYLLLNSELNDPANVIEELGAYYKKISNRDFYNRLEKIRNNAENAIMLGQLPQDIGKKYRPSFAKHEELTCRRFSGTIDRSWRVASFSYLASGSPKTVEMPDRDCLDLHVESISTAEKKVEAAEIFAFPKGAKAGTFFHEIFEYLDFAGEDSQVLDELVATKLIEYGYEQSWKDTVCNAINRVLSVPFTHGDDRFVLSQIRLDNRLNELEFYFPLKSITTDKLKNIFAKHSISKISDDFPESIERLRFSPVKGFMKGFMDLVFTYNNRFYLVDWKSNHLGNTTDDYHPEKLATVMKNNYYILQYHIYVIALHKYLSIRQPGYDYKTHFGGVYYVFLRGVDPAFNDKNGIYYDLPSEKLIDELSDSLIARPGSITG